jgi:hypothetical protein
MLDVRCWMFDVGCSVLDVRCSVTSQARRRLFFCAAGPRLAGLLNILI